MANYRNVTGSSDVPNFSKQLEVVTAFMGKTDLKIGVLYSSDESSSPYQLAELKKAAGAYTGMEISDRVVSDITTIDTQVHALLDAGVDCFVNLLDNTIVGKLESNILPLTNAFIRHFARRYGKTVPPLSETQAGELLAYAWPGNIRELQHTIEKAVILAEKNVIRASDLFIRPGKALSFSEVPNLEEVERQAILAAITQNEGNLTAAAEQLGVSRQTLYNKMKRFNL